MFTLYGTQRFRDRLRAAITAPGLTSTVLGDWYATTLTWRPQVALLVNETTLLPVLMPLAPARSAIDRIPHAIAAVLVAHGVDSEVIDREVTEMAEYAVVKTMNRSVVGMMTEFAFLADAHRAATRRPDLVELSVRLADTPCSPLYATHVTPERALAARLA